MLEILCAFAEALHSPDLLDFRLPSFFAVATDLPEITDVHAQRHVWRHPGGTRPIDRQPQGGHRPSAASGYPSLLQGQQVLLRLGVQGA